MDYDKLNSQILTEINRMRRNPQCYLAYLEDMKAKFKGKVYKGVLGDVQTSEGVDAVQDAIEAIRRQRPLHSLIFDIGLAGSAHEHTADCLENGLASHTGSDGQGPIERTEEHCDWSGEFHESIEFGFGNCLEAILFTIIDDGNPSRSNRKALFRKDLEFIGLDTGEHKEFKTIMVMVLTEEVREFGVPFYRKKNQLDFSGNQFELFAKEKTPLQEKDPDAPDEATDVIVKQYVKKFDQGEKQKKSEVKLYETAESKQRIVEIEDMD